MEAHLTPTPPCEPGSSPKLESRRLLLACAQVLDDMDVANTTTRCSIKAYAAWPSGWGSTSIFAPGRSPGTPLQFEQQFGMVFQMGPGEHAPDRPADLPGR